MKNLLHDGAYFVGKLAELGRLVRGAILHARAKNADLAGVSKWTSADAIYQIDTHVEPVIEQFCAHWSKEIPLVLIAEGIGREGREGQAVFPQGADEAAAPIRVIMDPIDGTRGLMYDKRAAWFLAGVAPNHGPGTRLREVFAAVQVELPLAKQSAADVLWAIKGQGAKGIREEVRETVFQKSHDLVLRPSQADNIDHSFASIASFFPATKVLAARLMEEIVRACIAQDQVTRGTVFDDQYMSTGGQLYELAMGHDRFVADLRPLFYRIQGLPPGMSVHPYDLASLLIAQEAGVILTDGLGHPLDGPLDVDTPLRWAGFANAALRARIEPVMVRLLNEWLKNPPSSFVRPNPA